MLEHETLDFFIAVDREQSIAIFLNYLDRR